MRECLTILFACYDGATYINWTAPNGEVRTGLLALCSLVVDGADYPWLVNNRGPTSLYGCGRCRLATSMIHTNVTQLLRWQALRRTYDQEVADLRQTRLLRTKGERDHFTQLCGLNAEAVDNILYDVFGVLNVKGWVMARHLAVEPLHTIEAGVFMQVQRLMIQLPQRLHEPAGAAARADSPEAAFADRVLKQSASSLHRVILAVPTHRRHSTWPVPTVLRLLTRTRGKQKPPYPSIEFLFCSGWHYRDLGRVMAVWVLQPDFLGEGMRGPVDDPLYEVSDFFGRWDPELVRGPALQSSEEDAAASGSGGFVPCELLVDLPELRFLLAEVWCLLLCWYDLFLSSPLSERQLQDLRVLDDEFHEAAKAILSFRATWKKHQMEEAPESKRDLGDQVSANLSEAAHKLTKRLYELCTNRSLTDFSVQLVGARNRVVASQVYCRRYEQSLKSSVKTPTSKPAQRQSSYLPQPQQKWTLQLEVDDRFRVAKLHSSCGQAQQHEAMLLQDRGYSHLFWAILNYLYESWSADDEDGRHWPLTTLDLHPSIMFAQTGCPKAAAATKMSLEPFAEVSTYGFVRVAAGDRVWFGSPIVAATVKTVDGTRYEILYCK
jgi:hypothetical protein